MNAELDRRAFLKTAALGSAAAVALPAFFGTPAAFADDTDDEHRISVVVAQSQAPTNGDVTPRGVLQGALLFEPGSGDVQGGGTFDIWNQASSTPKTILATGTWQPTQLVSYDTKGLPPFGNIQPSILVVLADFEGLASGATLRLICDVGAAGPAGNTGEPEGWTLTGTPFGAFTQLSPIAGLTHISIPGITIDL